MIIALAGRRIDEENADHKRFPLSAVPAVKEKLKQFFRDNNVTHIVSSGACGADLLAQEVAFESGIARTMVLPFDVTSFRKTSVTDRPGEWGKIYDKLVEDLTGSSRLITLNYSQQDIKAYKKTNSEILGRIENLSTSGKNDLVVLIVWEGKPKDKDDTTFGLMQEAQKRSLITAEINTITR